MNEESTIISTHISCEACGSSDAKSVYSDGHSFCFSCGKYEKGDTEYKPMESKTDFIPISGSAVPLKSRKLTQETCEKWSYKVGDYGGEKVQVASYFKEGKLVGQKIRTKDKEFRWLGSKNPGLYGMHLWKTGGKMVTVVEGEIDALSISQANGNRWPCCSVPHGANNAPKAFKDNLEYLESFESVVIMFDSDEPGQKAAMECAQLLTPGKAKIAQLPLKDASEMLVAGRVADLVSCMWNAKDWTPSGILNGKDMWDEVQKPVEMGLSYPWPSLTKSMYGCRQGEVIVLGAGTGLGKTTVCKEIAYHLSQEHKQKVGLLFLEEANSMTALSMMSIAANKPLHLPGVEIDNDQKRSFFDAVYGEGRVFLYNHFGSCSFSEIASRIRYLVVSCDVRFIFLDHLAALTTDSTVVKDERREIDFIMTKLASLVRELKFTLFLVSHLSTASSEKSHEEGGRVTIKNFRGSRSIGQWADTLWALERDQQAEDDLKRHTSTFRILKDRYTGQATGNTFSMYFNKTTNRLEELDEISQEFKKTGTDDFDSKDEDFTDF